MICEEVDRLIADYSAGALPRRTTRSVRTHLNGCPVCAKALDQLSLAMAAVEALPPLDPPSGLWNGVYNRITSPERVSRPDVLGRLLVRPRRVLAVGVAIASLAGAVIFGVSLQRPRTVAQAPEPAAMEYVQGHMYAASQDAFADRVSLGFVGSMSQVSRGVR